MFRTLKIDQFIEKNKWNFAYNLNYVHILSSLLKTFNGPSGRINDPIFSTVIHDFYNFFMQLYHTSFNTYIQKRITESSLQENIDILKLKHQGDIFVLTDVDYLPNNYKKIDIENLASFHGRDVLFILAYNYDFLAIKAIQELNKLNLKFYSLPQSFPVARYFHTDKIAFKTLISEMSNNHKEYFVPTDFENIFQALCITKNLAGDYVEIGVYQGASARVALNYMKRSGITRKSYFLDTYDGFCYASAYNSNDAIWSGTHTGTTISEVKMYISEYDNAYIVKHNIIEDDFPIENIQQICICNIDVDMYDAVKSAIYKVNKYIVKFGIIIIEDYGHTPSLAGAQYAVREFLEDEHGGGGGDICLYIWRAAQCS
jgi:hypothetical protein